MDYDLQRIYEINRGRIYFPRFFLYKQAFLNTLCINEFSNKINIFREIFPIINFQKSI